MSGRADESGIGPEEVVAFWRESGPQKWFTKDAGFDGSVRERFLALREQAAAGALDDWAETPTGALALILLLDQFSRNLFRGSAAAFAKDDTAVAIARLAVDRGHDFGVEPGLRQFFYMPFMHSERLEDQERCVRLSHSLDDKGTLPYARDHARIIRRFGRFPHRNPVLGRHTTPAEQAFLDAGGFAG